MGRTRLTVLVAVGLIIVSIVTFFTRRATGGVDAGGPPGVSSWEVTLTAHGQMPAEKQATIVTSSPIDFRHQHVFEESWRSDDLIHRDGRSEAAKTNPVREAAWKRRPMTGGGAYRLTYSFRCVLGTHHVTPSMRDRTRTLDGPPSSQTDNPLRPTSRIQSDLREVEELAAGLIGEAPAAEQFRAFHDHVVTLGYLKTERPQTALDCLRTGEGDDTGRSRLLVALCRCRGIPARVVTGLVLNPNIQPVQHRWVEAWIRSPDGPEGHWVPACPTFGHFGSRGWPNNYLVVRLDDEPVVRASREPQLTLFARPLVDTPPAGESRVRAFWRLVSLGSLPPAEQQLARFLLLLPVATVVVSVFRVLVGVRTYGVFSPALLGLIFRDLNGLPWGLGIFFATVVVGWLLRRSLDRFNLLLIPRTAVLLTLIVASLLAIVVVAARTGVHITNYVALFPLIILTHMVERFWTVEAEDGARASFKTLGGTVAVAVAVAVVVSPDAVGRWMVRYPETLGAVVAVLLLLGRYTGYRLTELYRFQDVIEFHAAAQQEKKFGDDTELAAVLHISVPRVDDTEPALAVATEGTSNPGPSGSAPSGGVS